MSKDTHKFPRLYKRTSAGKVQEWDISVTANSDGTATITTVQGQQGGKKQTYEDVVKEGKNLGKKNETTPYQQAFNEAEAKWNEKQSRKHYGLTAEESAEKRAIAPMLAHPYEKHFKKVDWDNAYMQPKLDGNRCHAFREGKKIVLLTREGLEVQTLPHIQEELLAIMPDGSTWDGELYVHGLSLPKINSLLRREQEDSAKVVFNIYDVLLPAPFLERRNELLRHFKKERGPLKHVETRKVGDENTLMIFQADCIDVGYEGAILRHGQKPYEAGKRSDSLLKVKTFVDEEFKVVDITDGRGTHKGMAVLTCVTKAGNRFDVTAPGTHDEKREVYRNRGEYVGRKVTVKFQCYTDTENPVPFHPVAKAFR